MKCEEIQNERSLLAQNLLSHTGFRAFTWTILVQLVMPMKLQNARLGLSGPWEIQPTSRAVHLENERNRTMVQPAPIPHLPVWWFNTLSPQPITFFKNKIKGKEMKGTGRVVGCWRDSLARSSSWITFALPRLGGSFPIFFQLCRVLLPPNSPTSQPPPHQPPLSLYPSVLRKPAWWITDVLWHIVSFITQQSQSH